MVERTHTPRSGRPEAASAAWQTQPSRARSSAMRTLLALLRGVGVLVLTPIFCLVITPLAALLRRLRTDPLRRALDRDAPTYWRRRRR